MQELIIKYEPDVSIEDFERTMQMNQEKDIKSKMTSTGPHRDDFSFIVNGIDIRKYGSQGQQRTAALSLKLSEIYRQLLLVQVWMILLTIDLR